MGNENNSFPAGWSISQKPAWTPSKLQNLISSNPYPVALAALKKRKEDCGYTDKWYRDERRKMNREWLTKVQDAMQENQRYIGERQAEITRAASVNYEHSYTERDYADLQFMQNLIKTRIAAEGQDSEVLIGRIVGDYLNTQVGARAIMFCRATAKWGNISKPTIPRRQRTQRRQQSGNLKRTRRRRWTSWIKPLFPFCKLMLSALLCWTKRKRWLPRELPSKGTNCTLTTARKRGT